MGERGRRWLIGGVVAGFVLMLVAVGGIMLSVLPFQYQQAHDLWREQRVRHYVVDVSWANGWDVGSARVEMRGNEIVRAIDPANGQPLAASKVFSAKYYASMDNLFLIIEQRVGPAWNWRNLLARYLPDLARKVDPCISPLGDVAYDPDYGFPTMIWYNDSWCANTFFNYSNVKVTNFTPLP